MRPGAFVWSLGHVKHPWGAEQGARFERLRADYPNVRECLAWAFSLQDQATGFGLVSALAEFWYVNGPFGEAREWTDRALAWIPEASVSPAMRAGVLFAAGVVALRLPDVARAEDLFAEAAVIWERDGDRRRLLEALFFRGLVRSLLTDRAAWAFTAALFERSLDLSGTSPIR